MPDGAGVKGFLHCVLLMWHWILREKLWFIQKYLTTIAKGSNYDLIVLGVFLEITNLHPWMCFPFCNAKSMLMCASPAQSFFVHMNLKKRILFLHPIYGPEIFNHDNERKAHTLFLKYAFLKMFKNQMYGWLIISIDCSKDKAWSFVNYRQQQKGKKEQKFISSSQSYQSSPSYTFLV